MKLSDKQRSDLREALRSSVGERADEFHEEDLEELGLALLEATAIILTNKIKK